MTNTSLVNSAQVNGTSDTFVSETFAGGVVVVFEQEIKERFSGSAVTFEQEVKEQFSGTVVTFEQSVTEVFADGVVNIISQSVGVKFSGVVAAFEQDTQFKSSYGGASVYPVQFQQNVKQTFSGTHTRIYQLVTDE